MEKFIKIIINISLLLGSGYCAKELLCNVEKMAIDRIEKGLSSSERLAKKLTGTKLNF